MAVGDLHPPGCQHEGRRTVFLGGQGDSPGDLPVLEALASDLEVQVYAFKDRGDGVGTLGRELGNSAFHLGPRLTQNLHHVEAGAAPNPQQHELHGA